MSLQSSRTKRLLHSLLALDNRHQTPETENITISLPRLPLSFVGARIAVVADMHLPDGLVSRATLLNSVAAAQPDAIFITGDLTNAYASFAEEPLRRLAEGLAAIAPCFAVPGNHEWRLNREPAYRRILTQSGVHYLCDSFALWQKGEHTLRIYGMGRHRPAPFPPQDTPTITLAHKPQYFPFYEQARWPLVVCGHAHGGQVRLGHRSLYAPGQGFLPRYTAGAYVGEHTTMIVSRGLGNSSLPGRLGNRPHLPVLVLSVGAPHGGA